MLPKKHITIEEAKYKIARFCSYQERTQQQVREKLLSYGLAEHVVEEIIIWLISEKFVDEVRYAEALARGKCHQLKWGKRKIEYALKKDGLSPYCIRKGLEAIDDAIYHQNLEKLIKSQIKTATGKISALQKQKIFRFLVQKGYSTEEITETFIRLSSKD